MTGKVVLDQGFSGWSARFAVRVASAVDLTKLAGEVARSPGEWYDWAHRGDVEYLRQLSTVERVAFEVRWLAEPGQPLSLYLLGRVDRPDGARAEADGTRALDRLARVPAHVNAEPLADRAEIEDVFNPFRVAPRGIAEVRKPSLTARPQRPDAPVRIYLAVPGLRAVPAAWPGVLDHLAAVGRRAMVSVGLVPTGVAPSFAQYLSLVADQYGALGRPGRSRTGGGLYAVPGWVDGDPFAATAERLYREAAARYHGTVLRLRITVATDGGLDENLAHAVAERIGRGVAQDVPGHSCVVERPASARDEGALVGSVRALGVPRWGGHDVWRSDGIPQTLRELCELADPAEAATAAWLPAAATGLLPGGFPTVAPARDGDLVARGGVRFENSWVHISGDVVANDKRIT
jgi:hypothetical protein